MTHDLNEARWFKSHFCSSDGCVEVAHLEEPAVVDGRVALAVTSGHQARPFEGR